MKRPLPPPPPPPPPRTPIKFNGFFSRLEPNGRSDEAGLNKVGPPLPTSPSYTSMEMSTAPLFSSASCLARLTSNAIIPSASKPNMMGSTILAAELPVPDSSGPSVYSGASIATDLQTVEQPAIECVQTCCCSCSCCCTMPSAAPGRPPSPLPLSSAIAPSNSRQQDGGPHSSSVSPLARNAVTRASASAMSCSDSAARRSFMLQFERKFPISLSLSPTPTAASLHSQHSSLLFSKPKMPLQTRDDIGSAGINPMHP